MSQKKSFRHKLSVTLTVLGITSFCASIGFIALAIWSMQASPVDLGKVYSVSMAQSTSEVEALIGQPTTVSTRGEGQPTSWYYSRPLLFHDFRVDFAPTGEVLRCVFSD